jgi:hypothetical protein
LDRARPNYEGVLPVQAAIGCANKNVSPDAGMNADSNRSFPVRHRLKRMLIPPRNHDDGEIPFARIQNMPASKND